MVGLLVVGLIVGSGKGSREGLGVGSRSEDEARKVRKEVVSVNKLKKTCNDSSVIGHADTQALLDVGARRGLRVGFIDGLGEGADVTGCFDGVSVGAAVTARRGFRVGFIDGLSVTGFFVGSSVGRFVGLTVGF